MTSSRRLGSSTRLTLFLAVAVASLLVVPLTSSARPHKGKGTTTTAFNEYHVWPVSSTASWTILSAAG